MDRKIDVLNRKQLRKIKIYFLRNSKRKHSRFQLFCAKNVKTHSFLPNFLQNSERGRQRRRTRSLSELAFLWPGPAELQQRTGTASRVRRVQARQPQQPEHCAESPNTSQANKLGSYHSHWPDVGPRGAVVTQADCDGDQVSCCVTEGWLELGRNMSRSCCVRGDVSCHGAATHLTSPALLVSQNLNLMPSYTFVIVDRAYMVCCVTNRDRPA